MIARTAHVPMLLLFALLACGESPAAPTSSEPSAIVTLTISTSKQTLTAVGDTTRFTAEATDAQGMAVQPRNLSWVSQDPGVARAASDGLVTAVGIGVARIHAQAGGVVSNTVAVSVTSTASPGPGQLAIQRTPSASTLSDLYLVNADGTGLTKLTSYPSLPGRRRDVPLASAWSPDGKQLVFETVVDSFANDFIALSMVNADGTGMRRLPIKGLSPAWSPDGTRIAFMGLAIAGYDIFVMDADGTNVVNLTNSTTLTEADPTWSPDSRSIAYSAGGTAIGGLGIYVMNPDGTGKRLITEHDDVWEMEPAWSPDGHQIAYVRWPQGPVTTRDIWVMNADGSGRRRIMVPDAAEGSPAWSPDGRRIAFVSNRDPLVPEIDGRYGQIWIVNVDGTGLTQVTSGYFNNGNPAWRPGT